MEEKVNLKAVPTRRSVDGGKVTDHHALLVTGEKPLFLSKEDSIVYQMIAGRMIEAFSEKCVKDTATVTAECAGAEFVAKGSIIKQAGWRAVVWRGRERGNHPPRLAGRRHADTESRLHHRGKDQAQTAAYRSHPAVRYGNGRQGD